jgi:hypothetical protein
MFLQRNDLLQHTIPNRHHQPSPIADNCGPKTDIVGVDNNGCHCIVHTMNDAHKGDSILKSIFAITMDLSESCALCMALTGLETTPNLPLQMAIAAEPSHKRFSSVSFSKSLLELVIKCDESIHDVHYSRVE